MECPTAGEAPCREAAISAMFADFSMADYLTGHRVYAYMATLLPLPYGQLR